MTSGRSKATCTHIKGFHTLQFCLESRLEKKKKDGATVRCLLNDLTKVLIPTYFSMSRCRKLTGEISLCKLCITLKNGETRRTVLLVQVMASEVLCLRAATLKIVGGKGCGVAEIF